MKEEKSKLIFMAKRLSDVAKDLENLSEADKKFIVERIDFENPRVLIELYNALFEYMNWILLASFY